MRRVPRGRPPLNLELESIISAVRRHGKIVSAARELHCSDAYIHVRLKREGLTLWDILTTDDIGALIKRRQGR